MLSTLPQVSREHQERLLHQIDRMPATGDLIGAVPTNELKPHISETCRFLTGLLVPHMGSTEATLYPELERLLQNRHSMTAMRREHTEIRRLVDEMGQFEMTLAAGPATTGQIVALRRVFFHLYALLKIHLAEEQLYLSIVEHGISDEAGEGLAAAMQHAGTSEF